MFKVVAAVAALGCVTTVLQRYLLRQANLEETPVGVKEVTLATVLLLLLVPQLLNLVPVEVAVALVHLVLVVGAGQVGAVVLG
jgi:hypothetical protein